MCTDARRRMVNVLATQKGMIFSVLVHTLMFRQEPTTSLPIPNRGYARCFRFDSHPLSQFPSPLHALFAPCPSKRVGCVASRDSLPHSIRGRTRHSRSMSDPSPSNSPEVASALSRNVDELNYTVRTAFEAWQRHS